ARGTVRRLSPGSRAHGPSTAAVLLREGGRRRAAPLVPRPACARSSRADRAEPAGGSSSVRDAGRPAGRPPRGGRGAGGRARDAGRAAGDPPRGDRVTGVSEQNTTASPTDETAAGRGPGGPLRVAVLGAAGRMGATVCAAVEGAADLELVARLDAGDEVTPQTLRGAQVAVDFTVPSATEANVHALIDAGVHAVVGTTGWTDESRGRVVERLARVAADGGPSRGVLIAPNFGLSAVLAMTFAAKAARYFESAEVVELHHPDKVDAPSGTA